MELHNKDNFNQMVEDHQNRQRKSRVFIGLLFVAAGTLFGLRRAGIDIPSWVFSWELFLIAFGLIIGAKHSFRFGGWIIPIIIGLFFMLDDVLDIGNLRHFIFPFALVMVGLVFIFKPKKNFRRNRRFDKRKFGPISEQTEFVDEDRIDVVAVFGGADRTVISKNFKGGDVTCVFGGGQINLSQADFTGRVNLDVTCVFGGGKLIVPQNWQVISEVTAVFGSIEDKRPIDKNIEPNKTLAISGTALFGGIEITSF